MAVEGIGLLDLASGMNRRGASMAPESALFIALQVAEALRDAPRAVSLEAVLVTAEGGIEITTRGVADEPGAIATVVAASEALLKPPTAPLRALLARVRNGEVATLDLLRAELDALLVPLNRAAAKRVLGRTVREHQRNAGESARPSDEPSRIEAATPPKLSAAEVAPVARAVDTTPDAAPKRVTPIPGAPGGKSALDTEPDAGAGIAAMLAHPVAADEGRVSHNTLSNPTFPRPPRLGSLGIPSATASSDLEPEAYASDRPDESKPLTANDTVIDSDVLDTATTTASDDAPTRRRGSSVVLFIAFGSLFVALALLAFAVLHR